MADGEVDTEGDDAVDEIKPISTVPFIQKLQVDGASETESQSSVKASSELSLWSDQENISKETRTAIIKTFGYPTMTLVQKKVCDLLPTDKDLLVRAKTGTGKTLAFLVAAYENVMKNGGFSRNSASILILSPTRELALQISEEADRFVRGQGLKVRALVGGEDRRRQLRHITEGRADIIVGTPGRLIDFLQSEKVMTMRTSLLKTVIFDEADQLLEMGFRDAIATITSSIPQNRQTLMFSATLSAPIRKIADQTLKANRVSLDTVPKDDVPTHFNVKQTYIMSPFSSQLATLYKVIADHKEKTPNAKIIVFFGTTKSVQSISNLFNVMEGIQVITLHSKLEQRQRTRISDRFRNSRSAALFTSDVSARGVDYPGVTLVVQFGIPTSAEQYIHRIGRTGRAGKTGEGVLILSPYEKNFITSLSGQVPIKQSLDFEPNLIIRDEKIQNVLSKAFASYDRTLAKDCFFAFLGYYKQMGQDLNMSRETLYRAAEDYAKNILGLTETPAMSPTLAGNLGFSRVKGVKIFGRNDGEERSYGEAGHPRQRSFGAPVDSRERSFGASQHRRDEDHQGGFRDRSSFHRSSRPQTASADFQARRFRDSVRDFARPSSDRWAAKKQSGFEDDFQLSEENDERSERPRYGSSDRQRSFSSERRSPRQERRPPSESFDDFQ
ncbi:hypothetical protein HDU97_001568 [Phlyctochytrium planicorne]|nr:hypothetical protein HDU97_001568 [Phlyctochytrium planicorne]